MKEKVLFWDVETSYIVTEEKKWGLYDEHPIERKVIQDMQILTIAWHWRGEYRKNNKGEQIPVVHCLGQDDFPDYIPGHINDKNLLEKFWHIINEAGVEVAHNGDKFDIKKLNARMMQQGLKPYSPPRQYDTLKAFRRVSAHTSNKLGDLAEKYGPYEKGDPGGVSTWIGCVEGDPKAWKRMKKYNKLDIMPLVSLYDVVTPWDKQSPAMNVIEGKPDCCTNCLSSNMTRRTGKPIVTKTRMYHRYSCDQCGKWQKGKDYDAVAVRYTN